MRNNNNVVRGVMRKTGSHGFGGCGGRDGGGGDVEKKKSAAFVFIPTTGVGRDIDGGQIMGDSHLAIRIERLICCDLEFAQLRRGHRSVL